MTDPSSDDPGGSPASAPDGGSPTDGGPPTDGGSPGKAAETGATASTDRTRPSDRVVPAGDPSTGGDSLARTVGSAVAVGVLGVLAYVAVSLVFATVGQFVGGFSLGVSLALSLVVGQYVAFVGTGLAYLRLRGFDRARIVEYLGIERPSLLGLVIAVVGAVATFAVALTLSAVVASSGVEPAQNQGAAVAMQNPAIIPAIVLAMFLVVGPCEEFLFRGVVQSRLRESLPAAPAIVVASAVFAPAHVISLSGGGASGVAIAIGLLVFPSLLFGVVYEYTGNLVVVALMHALYNSILLSLLYIVIAYGPELERAAAGGAALLPV
ncbi:CPBP family intramembrane glutamic endopeptidase [Halorubrum sp. BV1]|uniref:CPBP family intramembrane glutamic endopeptidase n=1 Tax=Halorubrum sp. BV1 TaxID=1498500 RepID=UPI0006798808|nr:CPBP family intramembrane glutamic endopeptidase [Halorubrum sp. BV1]